MGRVGQVGFIQYDDPRFAAGQFPDHRVAAGNRDPGIQDLDDQIDQFQVLRDQFPGLLHMARIPVDIVDGHTFLLSPSFSVYHILRSHGRRQ